MASGQTDAQIAEEVAALDARLAEIKPALLAYPNVLDVYTGIKTVAGLGTDVACFIVEVTHKAPENALAPQARIPARIEGYPVDVYDRQDFYAHSEVYCGGVPLNGGTLGMYALTTAANTKLPADTPVILTNQHVTPRLGQAVGVGSVCDCYCCACCEEGFVVDALRNATVDVAIASLVSETRYSHEILELGPVRGSAAPTAGMLVSKYGSTTKMTRARIATIQPSVTVKDHQGNPLVMTNQLRIVPVTPNTPISRSGDSGSVWVQDATSQVVGLNHAGNQSGTVAIANQMPAVLAAMNIQIPVMGTAGSIPLGVAVAPAASTASLRERVAALQSRLRGTPIGREWLALTERHVDEVRELVNRDRHAKVAWQRVQGPAFLAHWMKSAREGDHHVPQEIGGMRIENALIAMTAMLRERGSPALTRAVAKHYLTVLKLVSGCDTAVGFVDRVDAYTRHGPHTEASHGG